MVICSKVDLLLLYIFFNEYEYLFLFFLNLLKIISKQTTKLWLNRNVLHLYFDLQDTKTRFQP